MEPLLTNQRVFMWLCLLPATENTRKWKKRAYAAIALAMIVADLAIFLASIMYMLKFKSTDSEGMFYVLYDILAATAMANTIIAAFVFRQKIPPLFEKLTEIYGECKNFHFVFTFLLSQLFYV